VRTPSQEHSGTRRAILYDYGVGIKLGATRHILWTIVYDFVRLIQHQGKRLPAKGCQKESRILSVKFVYVDPTLILPLLRL
jgi:hypothetical protein